MSAIKINGTWQRVSSIKIKQNGVWNDHTALYARLDGAWHLIDLAAEAQGPAYHIWKAYADDAFGNGISLSPEGKEYIGFAVGQRVEEPDLSDPSLYDWSLIKGADGKDVDPEVLAEILEKQDGYNSSLYDVNDGLYSVEQALADADSRLKAADVALSQALQSAQVDFSSSVDSLNESISEVENDLLNLVSLSGEQGSSITQLKNTTDEQAQKIAVLETNDGSTRSRVASLESTSEEQATRLSSLGVWDGEAFATIKTLEETDSENASLIRTLEARGEEADSKIATLEYTSSSHASRLSIVETRSTSTQNRTSALEETTETHATRLTNVETKADDTESKVSTLEQTSEGHATRLTNVETKAASAVTKANNSQDSADTANSKVIAVTNRVSSLESTSSSHAYRLSTVETKADSNASKVSTLESATSTNASRIETVNTTQSNAIASALDTAKAYTDNETGQLKAERVIKADANGKVSGVHLLANGSGAEAGGKLYFQADEIAIVPPNWNGSSELDKSKFPFYFSEDRNYMYLDEATIQRLSAETIDSGSLAVDGLTLLSDNLSLPAGSVREHMLDPAFKDGIVRINPDAEILGGTKSVSSTGIGQGKKITVPALKSGGSAQKMTISVVGPNEVNRKDVQFDLEMKINGAPHNFSSGQSKIRLSSTIKYSTEDGGVRLYRSSFNFEDTVTLPAPTKGNTYEYEFVITNMSFSPANTSTYNFADKLKFSISVSEPTVSSGGFITDVRWSEVKEQPSFVGLDMQGHPTVPRFTLTNNPGTDPKWLRAIAEVGGFLPYKNGTSSLGTISWRFKEVHGVTLYENGTALSSKYLGKTATATNASKLGGRGYSEGTGANSIASRNSNGDIYARLFRSTYSNQSDISGAIAFRRSTSDNYIRFCSDMGAVRNFVGVYSKNEVYTRTESNSRFMPSSGDAFTSGNVVGSLNGKTSLATNDGYGNSNVTFNHTRGVPVQNGNSARIEVNTDSPSNPSFNFELGAGVTAGQAVQLTTTLNINLTDVRYKGNVLWHAGNIGLASNSWGGVTSKNVHGYIDIGPANTSYAHIFTDRPAFYFNKDLEVNGKRVWHNGNTGDIPKKSVKNTFTTDQVITGTGTIGANYSNASNGWLFIGTGSSGLGLDNNEIACTQELVMSAPSIRTGAAIDAESTLKVHDVATFQAATVHHGTIYARGITRFAAPNDAKQRVDVRDEDDQGRAHWYGESSSGGTRAFKHAWYDGSAYVNVDVSGQTVKFSGSVKAEGALYADGTALGTNQVVAVFSHPTQNTNVAIVGKNSANGGFRLESHADSAEMRVQTSTTSGGYSISNGDRGTIAAFRRNGDVVINGATHVQGGLKQDGHIILNGSDTWLRTKGDQGIYFSSYGGGWRMTDTTWIRAYGNKMLYITNGSTSSIRTTGGVHANQGFRRDNTGSSWISQRDSTSVAVYNGSNVGNNSYAAMIRQRHSSYTWTVGGLGNQYFGMFAYTNSRTVNGTDGYFRMDYRGNCTASGQMYAPDFIATSDRRVKDNIKVIPDALDKVCKLTGNTYTRNDLDNKESAGVIAQEVQEVLPEAVTEAEGRLQVAHNGVIGLLVEAVKELKEIVNTQAESIRKLQEVQCQTPSR
ncbi:tail fiber domain-containing protein [Pseudoalteromonas sp. UBA6610]|uniref:tail fiber domain-containing protein n=1 Tax=Pseudoalteromonas sp. UBA6610 TaxID=1947294 RepID=UPI00259266DF|nr:tail fiber domain-containing protein [Pseudoalteromonas sp. UBA6610]|tara:strand:+ start:56466 stop:61292 length:4827 start_codon:yes stop_codon:yes gene_type:complete